MTHTYKISGMTCEGCQAKVQHALEAIDGVTSAKVDWHKGEAEISMKTHVPTETLKAALKPYPKYQLSESHSPVLPIEEEQKPWLQTYKPILLIFAYLTGITFLIQAVQGSFNWMQWMAH